MAKRRRNSPQRGIMSPFTALAYLCAVLVALALCGAIGPGGLWRRSGLRKEYRSYLVLELPVPEEGIDQGPLAGDGTELPPIHQELMKRRRLSLPEYIDWLRRYPWEGSHLKRSLDGARYEVYYVPAGEEATRVPIPVGYEYFLSGNGEDGFIVTVWAG